MIDTYKHKGQRRLLVQALEAKGITDEKILDAFMEVPRHLFIDGAFQHEAYEDRALPIHEGQTISQPFTVAYQTQLLALKPKTKILEIGTGSGYQAAILCAMGMRVFSVERSRPLHQEAKALLADLGYAPYLHCGDGSLGWPRYQPFQRILVTAASPGVPEPLKLQLETGGRLVIPVGGRQRQKMTVVTRLSKNEFETYRYDNFSFVPLLGKHGFEA